jgi:hypothetical protein
MFLCQQVIVQVDAAEEGIERFHVWLTTFPFLRVYPAMLIGIMSIWKGYHCMDFPAQQGKKMVDLLCENSVVNPQNKVSEECLKVSDPVKSTHAYR